MWGKGKFYRFNLIKKIIFLFKILIIYFLSINIVFADLQKNLINKITATKTLSFNFRQTIAAKEETGKCTIKYPLLMKCDYQNIKKKTIISNGRTVAIIKKKYKKIYLYPIKTTPLFTLLRKGELLSIIRNNKPIKSNSNLIISSSNKKLGDRFKILFDAESLDLKGWKTVDAYSNNVSFVISNLVINKIIEDNFFKIPKEEDL